jgi:hypothetical protein
MTTKVNKLPLKERGWHMRRGTAEECKEQGVEGGWLYEHESGKKTKIMPKPGAAVEAAHELQDEMDRAEEESGGDPSADLRKCPGCHVVYDTNDNAQAEEHAPHEQEAAEAAAEEESPLDDDIFEHEEELVGRVDALLISLGSTVVDTGKTELGARLLTLNNELIEIVCARRLEGLKDHIEDAFRRCKGPITRCTIVACCLEDAGAYERDSQTFNVGVFPFDAFEAERTPSLCQTLLGQIVKIETLNEFQKLIRDHGLQAVMDYEPDERFSLMEVGQLYDALSAKAEELGMRRGDADEGAGDETIGATDVTESTLFVTNDAPDVTKVAVGETPPVESSQGASEALAALVPQMHPEKIRTHPLLLMRAGGLDESHVQELEEVLERGESFKDRVVVFHDPATGDYWLAEGNHRHEAARRRGALLDVDVREGILADAVEFAAGSNAEHGLKRSDDDKRLAVLALLSDKERWHLSDGLLAQKSRTTAPFVGKVREAAVRVVPLVGSGRSPEQIAAETAVPVGLVKALLIRLPEEAFEALTQNISSDTGERVGADGRVYKPRAAGAAPEESPSLFDERDSESTAVAEADAQGPPTTDEATQEAVSSDEESAPDEAEQLSKHYRLAEYLKPQPQGATTDELLAAGFTMFDISEAKRERLIERHENGRCFYAWKTEDIVEALREHGGRLSRLALEELGCQSYMITAALGEGRIAQPETGVFIPAVEGEPAGTRAAAAATPPKDGKTSDVRREIEQNRREPPRATVGEMLADRKGFVALNWIPGMVGSVQVTVSVDGDSAGAVRELVEERNLRLPEPLLAMIEKHIKASKARSRKAPEPSQPTKAQSKTAQRRGASKTPATRAAGKAASKKSARASKSPAKAATGAASKSSAKGAKSAKKGGRTRA